jgi:eukaryotic-like serine/threonine-protein kinase
LQNRGHAQALQQIVGGCFFSGMLASELAGHAGRNDREEIGICAMFHDLGKLIATFYLQEEAQQITQVARAKKIDEERAAIDVIGLRYSELGQGIARYWKLPPEIIDSMTPLDAHEITSNVCEREPARVMAACATDVAALTDMDEKARKTALAQISHRYAKPMGLSSEAMSRLVDHATERFANEAANIGLRCNVGKLRTEATKIACTMRGETTAPVSADSSVQMSDTAASRNDPHLPGELSHDAATANSTARGQLIAGIQDITETLAGEYDLAQALRIILETIYRSGRFARVLLFTRDVRGENLLCRLAFGRDAERVTSEQLPISLAPARTVFYGAISRGADVAIQDVQSDKVAPLIPEWYKKKLNARGMLLLPLMIKSRAAGLIYADCDMPAAQFEEEDLRLLRTLRSQAVMAIRQKELG